MSPLPTFPPPVLWVEVDGKLREPRREEIAAWLWAHWHAFIVTREVLQAARTTGETASRILLEYDQ